MSYLSSFVSVTPNRSWSLMSSRNSGYNNLNLILQTFSEPHFNWRDLLLFCFELFWLVHISCSCPVLLCEFIWVTLHSATFYAVNVWSGGRLVDAFGSPSVEDAPCSVWSTLSKSSARSARSSSFIARTRRTRWVPRKGAGTGAKPQVPAQPLTDPTFRRHYFLRCPNIPTPNQIPIRPRRLAGSNSPIELDPDSYPSDHLLLLWTS